MRFKEFARQWIYDNIQNRDIRDFLNDIVDLLHAWNLTGIEMSLYTSHLFQLLKAWNEHQGYDN